MSRSHSCRKSCRDLGRAGCDTFVFWTGIEAILAAVILPVLPLLSVPRDRKPTAPHTELSPCVELRGPSPRGFHGRDISIAGSCRWHRLFRDEKRVPSRCGGGPMAAREPKHIPQAAGQDTRRAGRCSSAAPRGDPRHRLPVQGRRLRATGGCFSAGALHREAARKNGRSASPTAKRCRAAARPERGCRSPAAVRAGAPAGPAPAPVPAPGGERGAGSVLPGRRPPAPGERSRAQPAVCIHL